MGNFILASFELANSFYNPNWRDYPSPVNSLSFLMFLGGIGLQVTGIGEICNRNFTHEELASVIDGMN
jgi:hypothetical protein